MATARSVVVTPQNALSIGKAAEYLVCADLLLAGKVAFPTDQGLPYDLVVENDGVLIRIQVKATAKPINVAAAGRSPRFAYSFRPYLRGKGNKKKLTSAECDIVALVALDVREIAYVCVQDACSTVQLAPLGKPIMANDGRALWPGDISQYTFEKALLGSQKMTPGFRAECRHGHPWKPETTHINKKGHRVCQVCQGAKHVRPAA